MNARIRWIVCALTLALGPGAAEAQEGPEAVWQQPWLAHLNHLRALAGVPPLRLIPVLAQVAQQQAAEMAAGAWRRPPSAAVVSERLRRVGYTAHDWREDFLILEADFETSLSKWRRTKNFQEALEGRFRDFGVGRALIQGIPFYVVLFGQHKGDFFSRATANLHDRETVVAEMLARVNAIRRQAGLLPLHYDPLLDRTAQEHAEDMLARSYFGHSSLEGQGPSERARANGYPIGAGENIVEQRFSVDEALEAWLKSPGHRQNILDPDSRDLGIGLAVGEGYDAAPGGYRVIWIQNFGRGR